MPRIRGQAGVPPHPISRRDFARVSGFALLGGLTWPATGRSLDILVDAGDANEVMDRLAAYPEVDNTIAIGEGS